MYCSCIFQLHVFFKGNGFLKVLYRRIEDVDGHLVIIDRKEYLLYQTLLQCPRLRQGWMSSPSRIKSALHLGVM